MSQLPLELLDIIQLTYESEDGLDPGVKQVGRCLAIAARPVAPVCFGQRANTCSFFWEQSEGQTGGREGGECNRIRRNFDYSNNSMANIRLADDRESEEGGRSWKCNEDGHGRSREVPPGRTSTSIVQRTLTTILHVPIPIPTNSLAMYAIIENLRACKTMRL
jgi:hypothetical protein